MARYSFRLPDIGEGIAEAEIVAWHVKIGDRVEEDAQLADMMTDKATVEMESPVSGIVVELAGEVGDLIPIGSTLAVIETEGEGDVEAPPAERRSRTQIAAETPAQREEDSSRRRRGDRSRAPAPAPAPIRPAPAPDAPSGSDA